MKKTKLAMGLAVALSFATIAFSDEASAAQNMHRLYNPNSGEHFYTATNGEKNNLVKVGWRYEGIGWTAPDKGADVYRLYNPNAGDHHYTTNLAEKNNLVKVGWRYEGVGWKSDSYKGVVLHRAYNPNARSGSHNYTSNKSEQNMLIKAGWKNEGTAWYGMNPNQQMNITVIHKGSDGKQLNKQVVKVKRDTNYTATSKSFSGYTLKGSSKQSVKADGNKTITFNYTKNAVKPPVVQKFTITIIHLGSDGKTLKSSSVVVEKGKQYTAKAENFSGYYGSKTATQTITVNGNSTITFKYAKKDPADKTKLQSLYNEVKGTAKGNYTEASWKVFQDALTTTKNVLANSTWQQEIDDTWWKLNNAYKNLVENTTPVVKYNVVVVHKSSDGTTLETEGAVSVEKGKQFIGYAKNYKGYTLQGQNSQTITVNGNTTLTFTYKKDVVEDLLAIENQLNSQVLVNINNHRRANGKSNIAFNSILQKASTIRAKELDIRYDHIRPNGKDSSTVAEELGYDKLHWNENIYAGNGFSLEGIKNNGGQIITNKWINSEGHNGTLLSNYDIEGAVGVYIKNNGNGTYNLYASYLPGEPLFSRSNSSSKDIEQLEETTSSIE